jgi:hypothetical protein
MPIPKKSTHRAGMKAEVLEDFLPLYTKNVQRVADLQKKSLEIAAEQNADFIETCKKAFHLVPETPGLFFFDLLGHTFDRIVETQKTTIDLVVEQSKAVTKLAEERDGSATKITEGLTGVFQQTLEQSVATQKKVLDSFSHQQKNAYEAAKKQFRISNPVAEAFLTGLDIMIETQKTALDIASKPLKRASAA